MELTKNSKPSVLVTGATGFVGGNLVEALLKKGCSVTCLVRTTSDTRSLEKMPVRFLIGDLENSKAMPALGRIDTVYHVAGAIKSPNRDGYFRTNQTGTRRLLEFLADAEPGLSRFVHVSSLAAAGPSREGRALTEGQKPNPISWYGESKLRSEEEVLKFSGAFPVTILRPSAVYGPRDRETLIIFRMVNRGCLFTPGKSTRFFSLIHVDDLTAALVHAGEQDTSSGEVFFISRPEAYTWDEVGRAIARELGRRYRRIAFPAQMASIAGFGGDLWARLTGRAATLNSQKVRELLEPSWLCNPSKAQARLGFSPQVDLEHGIRLTAIWYRSHEWL